MARYVAGQRQRVALGEGPAGGHLFWWFLVVVAVGAVTVVVVVAVAECCLRPGRVWIETGHLSDELDERDDADDDIELCGGSRPESGRARGERSNEQQVAGRQAPGECFLCFKQFARSEGVKNKFARRRSRTAPANSQSRASLAALLDPETLLELASG